ncbi:MAG: hypothetical protein KF824_01325 [Fimbriimonadaceae bacterium]|nr:hypothetical protein [Fimbriimonadaceae bacterium]QYK53546.1 MAG: hypothetical protein KF824_01325 [Fimbriimonadaceae bacterium]
MSQVLDCPVLGLDTEFPERLFIVRHLPSNKYGCYCFDGTHGLACFSDEAGANGFASWIDIGGMMAEEVSFDEAREIAKDRPMPIVSLMLLDNMEDPEIHFIR